MCLEYLYFTLHDYMLAFQYVFVRQLQNTRMLTPANEVNQSGSPLQSHDMLI